MLTFIAETKTTPVMKKHILPLLLATIIFTQFTACKGTDKKNEPVMKAHQLKEENITYTDDSLTMNGYVVYDESVEGVRPGVIVVHEWWGLNDYSKRRARELAEQGYIAFALDMYGKGQTAANPDEAMALAKPFYMNPVLAKSRFEAALAKLKSYAQTDSTKIGAIGYCFGGAQVINMAKMGEPLKGVVSFHGNLNVMPVDKALLKSEILVCHGAADPLVPQTEVDAFKKQMDSVGAAYVFKAYPDALHAFTNPDATANGQKFKMPIAYNAAADTASWKEMTMFFERVFK